MAMDLNANDEINFNEISAKALNDRSLQRLSRNLNLIQSISASNGISRDYRGLAELLDFEYDDIKLLEQRKNPALAVLEAWVSKHNQSIGMLIRYLEDMERFDIIDDCKPFFQADCCRNQCLKCCDISDINCPAQLVKLQEKMLFKTGFEQAKKEKDAHSYIERRKNQNPIQDSEVTSSRLATTLIEGRSFYNTDRPWLEDYPWYDAYLCYADEDLHFVLQLAYELENPPVNLKLFIRDRDMRAGLMEAAIQAQIIDEKCNRVLVILSPDYLRNPPCEFQTNFATGVATEKRMSKLIPIVYKQCEIPSVLKYYSKIDFTRPECLPWVKDRLIESIRGSSSTFVTSPLSGFRPEKIAAYSSLPRELPYAENHPIVTLPASENHIPVLPLELSGDILAEPMASIEATSEEFVSAEVTSGSSKKTNTKVLPRAIFRKFKGLISSSSTGKASTVSSGYQTQSSFDN